MPSPTYLLMNCYEEVMAGPSIRHFDLYRLEPGSNLERLGIQEAMGEDICLIEWPSRLPSAPENAISVSLAILNPVRCPHIQQVSLPGSVSRLTLWPHPHVVLPAGATGADGECSGTAATRSDTGSSCSRPHR